MLKGSFCKKCGCFVQPHEVELTGKPGTSRLIAIHKSCGEKLTRRAIRKSDRKKNQGQFNANQ